MRGSVVPGARGCVWDCAPSTVWQSPRVLAVFLHGGGSWTRFSLLSDPRECDWSGGSWGSPPQSVGGYLVEDSSGGKSPGLVKRLSLICKSLLGRNQPHENAISTQSLSQPLSCLRQKQFTQPPIKQG